MRRSTLCGRRALGGWGMLALMGPVMASYGNEPWVVEATHGIVASDSVHASRAGLEILKGGGNAVDAAVATGLALGVTRPYSTGLGGGGFMMIRFADGRVFVLDYRERAPAGATPDMYVLARQKDPDGPAPSRYTGLAVAVPGLLAGHAAAIERFGTRKLKDVIAPAQRLAAEGFPVDAHHCSVVQDAMAEVSKYPSLQEAAAFLLEQQSCGDEGLKPGFVLRQRELARSLQQIADEGPGAFYGGAIGREIVGVVRSQGGIMTEEDLKAYRATWREPIRSRYRQYEVLLMPPPSSGGICIAETLNILENWDLAKIRGEDASLATHLTVEALKHAMADRARHLGDTDFVQVPVARLTSEAYAAELARRIDLHRTSLPPTYGWTLPEDSGTSHYCVVDRWGNVVSATETINTSFGSMVPAGGIILNNEMDDFTAEPGKGNAFNLLQSAHNAVAPGKRPLSSMSPTIVLEDGRPILAVGASGGPRIITATLQVIVNVLDYRLPLVEAVGGPRLHHQWEPDIVYRNGYGAEDPVITGLARRGHVISERKRDAVVQAVRIEPQRLTGVSDPRKGGEPAGY